jgi:hypothetical protein
MPRSIRLADKLGAAAGVAFTLLMFVSVAVVDPERGVSDQELQSWWADSSNRNGLVISMYSILVACPLFLLFVSRLRKRLQFADAGGWADLAFACGIVVTAALGVVAVTRGVVAGSMRFEDEPLPGVDMLRFQTDLVYAVWDLAILFAAVLIAVASILAMVTHVLPRWLAWLGVIAAAGSAILLAIHVAPLSLPLLFIWVLASSVQLVREPAAVPVGGPRQETAEPLARGGVA